MPVYTTFSKGIIFCPTYFESLVAKLLEIIYCYDFDALWLSWNLYIVYIVYICIWYILHIFVYISWNMYILQISLYIMKSVYILIYVLILLHIDKVDVFSIMYYLWSLLMLLLNCFSFCLLNSLVSEI